MTTALLQGEDALANAVQRCRQAQARWQDVPIPQRLRPIETLRQLVVSECDALCAAVEQDIGKPTGETIGAEVLPLADALRFLVREAPGLLKPRRVSRRSRPAWLWGQSDTVHRRPRGLVGIIGTWNYPLMLCGVQIAQSLTAGNGVIWKPSEVAPASASALFSLIQRAGFPEGLIHKMEASHEGGPALVESDIDHLVFTGGAATGRVIASRLAQRHISSTMELSGCDALFLLPDGDVKLAAQAAWFGFNLNRGQTCVAVRRAFVHRSLYAQFLAQLEPRAASVRPVQLALASSARQIERLVGDAVGKGARILGGGTGSQQTRATGHEGEDRFCRPTVVADVRAGMDLCREASFGPLLAVVPFDDLEVALAINAVCPYGLGASVFSRHPARAEELARRLRTGFVTINDVIVPAAHPATPFGGLGHSGWGHTQGAEGLIDLTVPQVVSVRGGSFRPHYDLGAGRDAKNETLTRGLLNMTHGSGLRARWRALWQVIRAIRKR
jgi:acyl-CoA reductase-like NAD-dependent aldehyde dehydrogenase